MQIEQAARGAVTVLHAGHNLPLSMLMVFYKSVTAPGIRLIVGRLCYPPEFTRGTEGREKAKSRQSKKY